MKNVRHFYLMILPLLCGTTWLMAQNRIADTDLSVHQRMYYEHIDNVAKQSNSGIDKALGTVIWEDSLSDPTQWTTGNAPLGQQGSWLFGVMDENSEPYLPNVISETPTSYAYFSAIPYLGNTQVQHAYLQKATPIDLSDYTRVEIRFYSGYRRFLTAKAWLDYSLDNGTTWDSIDIHQSLPINASYNGMYQALITVNNSSNFLFRFRWDERNFGTSGAGYGWVIDDVSIRTLTDIDAVYTRGYYHVQNYWYSQIPKAQMADTLKVEAFIANKGGTNLTNVKLELGGAITAISNPIDIPYADTKNDLDSVVKISVLQSDLASLGVKTITRKLTMDQTPDDIPENNTFVDFSFEVTDSIYAVDRGTLRRLPWNSFISSLPDAVGATYDIYTDAMLKAVDVKFHESSLPEGQVSVAIYKYNTATGTTNLKLFGEAPIATSSLFTLGDRPTNQFYSIPLSDSVLLEANHTYLALVIPSDTTTIKIEHGQPSNNLYNFQTWWRLKNEADRLWATGGRINLAVRLNFGSVLPICDIAGGGSSLCVGSTMKLNGLPSESEWSSSDETIATVTDGVVSALKTGTVTITYDGATCTKSTRVIKINNCTPSPVGVDELGVFESVLVFPNPTNDEVNVQFDLQRSADVTIELHDLSGRILQTLSLDKASTGTNNATFNVSTQDQGVYLLVLRSENASQVTKLIKQ